MPQWSKPFETTINGKTADGRDYQVTRKYVDRLASRPFQPAPEGAQILERILIDINVAGDISEDEAREIFESIKKRLDASSYLLFPTT